MDASGSSQANRSYYDAFSENYEKHRGDNDPGGYHELLDEMEADFVRRFGNGKSVLEVGCGTGLVLERIARFSSHAQGIDLSPGMLERARAKGLDVVEGSATSLPFPNAHFDVCCSFKVLAHIPEIDGALREMARVTRPGGVVIAEFYNPFSLRGLAKRLGPAGTISGGTRENSVYTRFDSPAQVSALTPAGCTMIASRGIRIVTPMASVMKVEPLRRWFRAAEWRLCDSPLRVLGGFYVAAFQRAAQDHS